MSHSVHDKYSGFINKVFLPWMNEIASVCNATLRVPENEIVDKICNSLDSHIISCKEACSTTQDGEPDKHKQAACICATLLDVSPLEPTSILSSDILQTKESYFYFPNELLALMCSCVHIHYALANEYKKLYSKDYIYDMICHYTPDFPKAKNDHNGYLSNFMHLISWYKEKNCYNYFSLSKLFFHYDVHMVNLFTNETLELFLDSFRPRQIADPSPSLLGIGS